MSREKKAHFAKLEEQSECYFEMAAWSARVATKCRWRGARRTNVEKNEKSKGNEDQAGFAKEHCGKAEVEVQTVCDTILCLLEGSLVSKASNDESKAFDLNIDADYYRYMRTSQMGTRNRVWPARRTRRRTRRPRRARW